MTESQSQRVMRVFPTLFHLGHLSLPTFGALAAAGLILALLLSAKTSPLAGVDPARLWDSGFFAVLAAFLLSRILLALAYQETFRRFPILLLAVPSLTPTGMFLTVLATAVWLRFNRIPILRALDAWAPCALLVWCFLALGHFAEGSDPGIPTTLPWGIPAMPGEPARLHPVALYAAFTALLLAAESFALLRRRPAPGTTAGCTLIAAGLAQFLLTFLRQPASEWSGLDPLQWVAAGLIVAGCALIVRTLVLPERQ